MRIIAKIQYYSNEAGAGKLRVFSRGPGAMTRTIGYPHELNRDEGRRHALALWARAWEKKHDAQLVLESRREAGAVFSVHRTSKSSLVLF